MTYFDQLEVAEMMPCQVQASENRAQPSLHSSGLVCWKIRDFVEETEIAS